MISWRCTDANARDQAAVGLFRESGHRHLDVRRRLHRRRDDLDPKSPGDSGDPGAPEIAASQHRNVPQARRDLLSLRAISRMNLPDCSSAYQR